MCVVLRNFKSLCVDLVLMLEDDDDVRGYLGERGKDPDEEGRIGREWIEDVLGDVK